MRARIGIDLGTTYSVTAHVDDRGEAVALTNADGAFTTPSVVYFDEGGRVVVGSAAKDAEALEPDRVVTAVKRDMGSRRARTFDGMDLTPEGISAIILRALAESAADELGVPVDQLSAVITVPAYFGVAEKEATAQAAQIAGLDLLELIAEPVAATVSYGVDTGASGLVLAYDLGGGTFDTTILDIRGTTPTVVVTDGSSRLGGLNWDERLVDLLGEGYVQASGDPDALDDDVLIMRLVEAAEDAKKVLSTRESARTTIRHDGRSTTVEVRRAQFEERCTDLVEATLEVVDRAMAEARTRTSEPLVEVILVGGATRMPMISAALESHLGVPVQLRDPDLAVAKGAALHAAALERARLSAQGASPSTPLSVKGERAAAMRPAVTVLPRALGVLLHDSHDPSGTRQLIHHVIAANTPLPVSGAQARFATILPDQDRIRVEVYEQAGAVSSEEVGDNRRVLDGELSGLPRLKAGSPIDVELGVAADGRITCTAIEPKSGSRLVLESYMDGVVDAAEVAEQTEHLGRLTIES